MKTTKAMWEGLNMRKSTNNSNNSNNKKKNMWKKGVNQIVVIPKGMLLQKT